ncbi:MAG: glycosyltransferase family 4 protein [Gemmatimonadota bacterium]|nr:glycosyltransferase family 4 protein [Gemmatimonadota bacterium]
MRLLVLLTHIRPTGLVRQLLESLSLLDAGGVVEPIVYCVARDGADTGPLQLELTQRGIAFEIVRERGPFDPAPLRALRSRLTQLRPDLMQTHGYKPTAYALLVRREAAVPWIAFYHGRTATDWRVRLYHAFDRWGMGRADTIITVAEGVDEHFAPADRNRLRVVPNGVVALEPPIREASAIRKGFGIEGPGPVVGFVGRLSEEKGPDLFVEAYAHLAREYPTISALIVGDGPMRADLERQATSLGVGQSTRFTGHVARVSEMYRAMDVLLISSRSEVFPNVLLEAVDACVPVAATRVGGIPGVAADLVSVVLADSLVPAAIARAGNEALQIDRSRCVAAREQLHDTYSQQRRAEALAGIYTELTRVSQ